MNKKIILLISLILLCAALIAVFWDPIIDWLPIDQSSWKTLKSGEVCYQDEDGDPVSGWYEVESNIYYFDPVSFAMQTGWVDLSDGRYYLGDDGIRRTGWQTVDGERYYLGDDGICCTGWQTVDGKRYYLGDNGVMQTGWLEQEKGMLYLNEQGNPQSGWVELEDGTYYLDDNSIRRTGWLELDGKRFYLDEEGRLYSGWLEQKEGKYYIGEEGSPLTGWQTIEENIYYLGEDGIMQTGWLELDGQKYYLKEDGTAARGKLVIDEATYYFTSTGANIILVNYWNPLHYSFAPEVVKLEGLCWIAPHCADATKAMLSGLEAAVGETGLLNGYRSYTTQYDGFFEKVKALTAKGVSYDSACKQVRRAFAYPGTSEHQLGVALDVMGASDLYYQNGENDAIKWLWEHCWDYGFILRYPDGKSHITGIIYEPWHFRYVGTELAMELKDSGLCLEEYLDALTNDGTTCGNPEALKEE